MGITLEQSDQSNVIRLEGAIDIASAAELKELLLQALGPGREVRVELEGATDLDVTAAQLLWAAKREAKASGAEFALAGQVPEPIVSMMSQAGFPDFATSVNTSQNSGVEGCQP